MKQLLHDVKLAIMAIAAVLAPVKGAALTALLLCILDLFTGLLAARKQGKAITSNGLGKTVVKIVVYECAILLTFLVDQFMAGLFPLSNIVSGIIGMTELKSCLENMNILSGGGLLQTVISTIRTQSSNNGEGDGSAPKQ